jgi:hypothetical protein
MSLINRLELEEYQKKLRTLTDLNKNLEKELWACRILLANLKEDKVDIKTRFLMTQLEGVGGKEAWLRIILGLIRYLRTNLLNYSELTREDLDSMRDDLRKY